MKKLFLISVMALVGMSASAQLDTKSSAIPQSKSKVVNMPQSQRSYQAVAPLQGLATRNHVVANSKLTLDPAKVKPVTRAQRTPIVLPAQSKAFAKGQAQSRSMVNLQPTLTLSSQVSAQARAASKAPAFVEKYVGVGLDYKAKESVQWTMTPSTATVTDKETGEEKEANVLLDVIPTPDFLSELYPNGIPVLYTIDEEGVITIEPQAVAHYVDETTNVTNYVTLFAANSDDERCIISLKLDESGKLTITDGNWICFGEFAGVDFDPELSDGEAYLGWDELIANVSYYSHFETIIDKEYYGHGVDYFANEAVDWVMQRGKTVMDNEESYFFINMSPMLDIFSGLYPNGIDVEYKQEGNIITVEPQVIASTTGEEAEYIMICSGTADDGVIVLTEGEDGSLKTIDGESVILGAWSTDKFDPTFETYQGSYSYIDNVKYRLPDAPAEAPKDVACEPNELVLFAGMGYSGYSYNDNLAVMGAYAPTTFRNCTMDIATNFEWSVSETDRDDVETTLTGNDRSFTVNTKGDYTYENFSLTAYDRDEASEPYKWGTGHALNSEETAPRYEAIHAYAGAGASSFKFSDDTYAVMTRQNPDYDLTFYVNWATPDIAAEYNGTSMSTIYSYQGKPATPLYLTGVTLPMVSFEAKEDFNLHIKLCKCERSLTGTLKLGDIIAEGDATLENVNSDYDAGITAVEFTELYVEDEFGMSEALDYLFIEDEFVIVIEGWDNGTFSGVLGSQEFNFNEITSTWFQATGQDRLRSYGGGWPQLFIGLLDATYGYLHTEDNTDLSFGKDGGTSTLHIDPMYYSVDEETEEYSYLLYVESVTEDGEEAEEIPEWISVDIANEDYTTAIGTDEEGNEYEYFVNGIDYDMVITVDALPEGVDGRTAEMVFMQKGALLKVKVSQGEMQGISTVVTAKPLNNKHVFNLAGQRVNNAKGIVVKDGRKVIVK